MTVQGLKKQMQDEIYKLESTINGWRDLPFEILKTIFRQLPTQKDRYQACFVHPVWSATAITVLWESPEFFNQKMLKAFVRVIQVNKSAALRVRRLRLCVRDAQYPTVFRPVNDATIEEHVMAKKSMLADPVVILFLLRRCENIQSLTIYGYLLEPKSLEQLVGFLPNLQELSFIGSLPSRMPLEANSAFLPRLRSLSFALPYPVLSDFAAVLAKRCHILQSLQISLETLGVKGLTQLCKGNLNLTSLTLTDASNISCRHVNQIISAFPGLTKLCLDGVANTKANGIVQAAATCVSLHELEIYVDLSAESNFQELATDNENPIWSLPDLALRRLIVKNLAIDDISFDTLMRHCRSLAIVGLFNCWNVTDTSMVTLCETSRSLQQLHIIDCRYIGTKTIRAMAKTKAAKTLRHIHVQSCGDIKPRDIYHLCCVASSYYLTNLCLVGYQNIAISAIGSFAIENLDHMESHRQTDGFCVTLNETAIDALANTDLSNDPDFSIIPRDRSLTNRQTILLAKMLNMPLGKLNHMIQCAQDDNNAATLSGSASTSSSDTAEIPWENTDQIPQATIIPPTIKEIPSPNTRLNQNMMDTTSICNANSIINTYQTNTSTDPELSPLTEYSSLGVDEKVSPSAGWSQDQFQDLGGWGVTNDLSWLQPSKDMTPWEPDIVEKYQEQWKHLAIYSQGVNNRNVSPLALEDGWGTAEAIVPWENTQGCVQERLEEQKNTPYYTGSEGRWKQLGTEETVDDKQGNTSDRTKTAGRFSRPVRRDKGDQRRSDESGDSESPRNSAKSSYEGNWTSMSAKSRYNSNNNNTAHQRQRRADDDSSGSETHNNTKNALPKTRNTGINVRRMQMREAIPPERMPGNWGTYTTYLAESYQTTGNDTTKEVLIDTKTPEPVKNGNGVDSIWKYMDISMQTQSSTPSEETERSENTNEKPGSYQMPIDWAEAIEESSSDDMGCTELQPSMSENEQEEDEDGDDEGEEEEKHQPTSDLFAPGTKNLSVQCLPAPQSQPTYDSGNDSITFTPLSPTPVVASPLQEGLAKSILTLKIETPKCGEQPFVLYENCVLRDEVRKFCDAFGMQEDYDRLVVTVEEKYVARKTKLILSTKQKAKKAKKAKTVSAA
ncbi:hypothetical protein EC973_006460 [Apophysomyces ossiformis]|uniref:F-box domain-containing protein n=1 Tax=Apophysomyces ossiformis TaxID=679940 RepID=A0A8H7EUK9_9FUNG|nr:hypothetical protein EC973_006460 [Apophysomyces ossiformis]